MAISMKKYVDIRSGINNIRTATEKDLIARIFTSSDSLTQDVVECEDLEEVGNIFEASSDEYKIAEKYFNFINKYARSPRKISFAKNLKNGSETIVRTTQSLNLSTITAITNGTISCSWGTSYIQISGINLSLCTSLEEVADALTSKFNETVGADGSEVITQGQFNFNNSILSFTAGVKGNYSISFSLGVAEALKLDDDSNPTRTAGIAPMTIGEAFEISYQTSNNFATFVFLGLTDAEDISDLASYVALNHSSEFVTIVPVTAENYSTIQTAVSSIDGVSLELCGATEETGLYNFVLPMAITATTDYNKENGTVNYMYNQDDDMIVMVDTDDDAEQYDKVKVNYYGRTQTAGQKLAFYQNGVLQGKYQDQNIFVNEIWLKDALTTKFLNYMLLTPNWYANKAGQGVGQGLIIDIIERAKLNGTITTEKEITENDKVYIYNITADENAWRQIYQLGYYLVTSIEKVKINNQDIYQFKYTLVYSKGDSIKKVEGQNILI